MTDQVKTLAAVGVVVALFACGDVAQAAEPATRILITHANVFDGVHETLASDMSVLVEGNKIAEIDKSVPVPPGATVIDAKGKVLMPGLIDAHNHPMFAALSQAAGLTALDGYLNLVAAKNAERLLLQGFTSLREGSGNSFSLKRAIDEGLYVGPRIYPTGPMICQTSGHADYRPYSAVPAEPDEALIYISRNGHGVVADGVPEVMKRVREALRMGATQIKLASGGGVASNFDPLDVAQYTYEELEAAVDVAATWNTYVMVHAYTPTAIQTALRAGVQSIEHGQLMDEGPGTGGQGNRHPRGVTRHHG